MGHPNIRRGRKRKEARTEPASAKNSRAHSKLTGCGDLRKEEMPSQAVKLQREFAGETITIRFKPEHKLAGFAVLLYNGQVQALPNDAYVVGAELLTLLDRAHVPYEVVRS